PRYLAATFVPLNTLPRPRPPAPTSLPSAASCRCKSPALLLRARPTSSRNSKRASTDIEARLILAIRCSSKSRFRIGRGNPSHKSSALGPSTRAYSISDCVHSERGLGPLRQDFEDILVGQDWRETLKRLIDGADTIIFIISPRSMTSEVCQWE